jgi:hypothetical protein
MEYKVAEEPALFTGKYEKYNKYISKGPKRWNFSLKCSGLAVMNAYRWHLHSLMPQVVLKAKVNTDCIYSNSLIQDLIYNIPIGMSMEDAKKIKGTLKFRNETDVNVRVMLHQIDWNVAPHSIAYDNGIAVVEPGRYVNIEVKAEETRANRGRGGLFYNLRWKPESNTMEFVGFYRQIVDDARNTILETMRRMFDGAQETENRGLKVLKLRGVHYTLSTLVRDQVMKDDPQCPYIAVDFDDNTSWFQHKTTIEKIKRAHATVLKALS